MAEVGLVHFAQVAREVAETVFADLPQQIFEACLSPTGALGYPLPDALRGLDLPGGRSAAGRASGVAHSAGRRAGAG
jgi:hypothetical protein